MLKAAFVQGRLAKDELDARVGQAFASRTYAELAALTADIPAGLAAAQPLRKAARTQARLPMGTVVAGAVLILPPAMVLAIFLTKNDLLLQLFAILIPWFSIVWIAAGAQMFDTWHKKRSRGQLPPSSAQRGPALEGERDGGPGNDLMLCQAHRDTRVRRLLGHSVTQRIWRSVPTRRASAGLCT